MLGWRGGDEGLMSVGEGVCGRAAFQSLVGWGGAGCGEFHDVSATGLTALPGLALGVVGADPGQNGAADP